MQRRPGACRSLRPTPADHDAATRGVPLIATDSPLAGQYAVFMVDMDIPTNAPPQTSTLLHWAQVGLTSNPTPTVLNTTMGTRVVHVMQNLAAQPPMAEYFGPNPPARMPLQHRYAFVAVDHSMITRDGLGVLTQMTQERRGFDAMRTLTAAGLGPQNVVAGDYFRVTNTGPVRDGTAGGGGLPNQPGQPNGGISPAPGQGQGQGNGGAGSTAPPPLGAQQPAAPVRQVGSSSLAGPPGRAGVACMGLAAVAVFMCFA